MIYLIVFFIIYIICKLDFEVPWANHEAHELSLDSILSLELCTHPQKLYWVSFATGNNVVKLCYIIQYYNVTSRSFCEFELFHMWAAHSLAFVKCCLMSDFLFY